MSLEVGTRIVDGVAIVNISGRLTLGNESSGKLRKTVNELLEGGNKKILLDLGAVSYLDSSGLGELVSSYSSAAGHGSTIKLLNLQQKAKDLLQMTKLHTLFEVSDNRAPMMNGRRKSTIRSAWILRTTQWGACSTIGPTTT